MKKDGQSLCADAHEVMDRTANWQVKRHSIFSNILFWIKTYWKWTPGVVLLTALKVVLGTLTPLVGIYLPKLVLDLLAGNATAETMIGTLGIWAILVTALYGVNNGLNGKYFLQNTVRFFLLPELYLKSLSRNGVKRRIRRRWEWLMAAIGAPRPDLLTALLKCSRTYFAFCCTPRCWAC